MNEQEKSRLEDEMREDILDLLCAPSPTDDIEFDGYNDSDEATELDFIEGWIEEERSYNEEMEHAADKTEAKSHV